MKKYYEQYTFAWWKENYTVENGPFWYLTSKFSKEV